MRGDRLDALNEELRRFVEEREWGAFHDPKNLAMLLASEAGELLAELRWVPNAESDERLRDPELRMRVAAELADVGIAVLLLCQRIDLDFADIVRNKIVTNAVRYPGREARGKADRPKNPKGTY